MFRQRFQGFSLLALAAAAGFIGPGLAAHAQGLAKIDGTVRDASGAPIAGAKVFVESGLDGPLLATETGASGAFAFAGVPPGTAGVFAIAPGRAIDGRSVKLALDASERVDISLPEPGTLAGTVQEEKGKPIAGARITRVLIRGDSLVGIPLSKLGAYGVVEPVSDAAGQFSIAVLPQGAEVSLKVAHAQFAQEAPQLRVGDKNARVTLTRGVLVSGNVVARGRDLVVPNATLLFVNANPPNDTVVARSQGDGSYALRLKPGPWLYQASGPSFRTSNSQRVLISAEFPSQRLMLQVAGTASLRGSVKDAKSGQAVAGARLELLSSGVPAAIATTGPTGTYELTATEGEAVVRLTSAPGFLLPPDSGLRVTVHAGQKADVPTFWVAPLPRYSLEVIDAAEKPVAGAIVRVLRPEQLGWYATDQDGLVELSFGSLPSDGTVVGMVEHPSRADGALFAITRDRSTDAIVQLMPLTSLSATIVNEKKSPVPGVLVEARTSLAGIAEPITLWRAFSARDGMIRWPAVVPKTPLSCVATSIATADAPSMSAASAAILPEAGAPADGGTLVLPGDPSGRSTLGKKYTWYTHAPVCGTLPADAERRAAVIVHVPAAQAAMMADVLAQAQRILNRPDIVFAVVTTADVPCGDTAVPILRGKSPSSAYTFVVSADSIVTLECAGLPPVSSIGALAPRS